MTIKPVAWLRKDRFKAMEAVEKEGWIAAGWLDIVEDYTIPCFEGSGGKVYIGYECYFDYCDVWEQAVKVFDCEVKALLWAEEVPRTDTEWRSYKEMEVE